VTRAELLELLEEARHAPSVHNIQPARWRLEGSVLELLGDPGRRLPVADPSGHDVRVSLGAAAEGMAIALAARGMTADVHVERGGDIVAGAAAVARIRTRPGAEPDLLGAAVTRRATFRGAFASAPADAIDAVARDAQPAGDVLIRDAAKIRDVAKLADQAQGEFLLDPAYWRETWRWLRLSPTDPNWKRDGLNAEALALSGFERVMGGVLMQPAAFELMRKIGLAGALTSERSKIETASALLIFTAPNGEDPFVTGRAFYRRWLQVTAAGLALCPMSVLADSKRANAEIRRTFAVPAERRIVNVLRIGAPPPGFPSALTPRLPASELVLA